MIRMTLSLKSRIFTTTNKLLLISIPKNLLEPDPDLRRDVHHGRVQLQPQAAQKLHPRQRQKPLQFRPGKNNVIKCKKASCREAAKHNGSILASRPAAPGLIPGIPGTFSEE